MSNLKRVSVALLLLCPLIIPIYITRDGVQPYSTRHLIALGAIALIALFSTFLLSRLMRRKRRVVLVNGDLDDVHSNQSCIEQAI